MKTLKDYVGQRQMAPSKKFPGLFYKSMTIDESIEIEKMSMMEENDRDPEHGFMLMFNTLKATVRDAEGNSLPGMETPEEFRAQNHDLDYVKDIFNEVTEIMYGPVQQSKKPQGKKQ